MFDFIQKFYFENLSDHHDAHTKRSQDLVGSNLGIVRCSQGKIKLSGI